MREWLRRAGTMVGRRRWRRELEEEMRLHRDLMEERRGDGKRFGNELLLRERSADAWGWGGLESLGQDLRHGLRLLRRTPVATALALLSLTLGIGANLALLSVINAVMLRPLPVAHPEQLVQVLTAAKGRPSASFTNPMWEQVRDHQQALTDVFAWSTTQLDLNRGGPRQSAMGQLASGGYFGALGVRPVAGRLFGPGDDHPGCPAVADISQGLWESRFGGEPSAVGRSLSLNGRPFQIIGVTPGDFFGMDVGTPFQVAVPLCTEPLLDTQPMLQVRDAWFLSVAGRLPPGRSRSAAAAQLNARMPGWLAASVPDWTAPQRAVFLQRRATLRSVASGISPLSRRYGPSLEVLLGIAALVLLVACANLAGLMLARAEARRAELATRMALGASRGRVVRQLLTESLLLAGAGTALGAGLAAWADRRLQVYWSSAAVAWQLNLSLDGTMLAAAVGLTLVTAALVGWVPALRATRLSLAAGARRELGRGAAAWRRLAAVQIAISVVLLAGAGLFLRSFVNLTRVDLGFDPARVSLIDLRLETRGKAGPAVQRQMARDLEALRTLPGVTAAAQSFLVPTSGLQWDMPLLTAHRSIADAYYNAVSPGYFATLRTPVLAGRDFGPGDGPGAPAVVILNRTAARMLFPSGGALGQAVHQDGGDMVRPAQVVGVVADAKYDSSLRAAVPPTAYYPLQQLRQPFPTTNFELRSELPAATVAEEATAALRRADPETGFSIRTFESQVAGTIKPERLLGTLSALFGGLALLLTAIGLYGIMAQGVQRRRREFGVRLALGAPPRVVTALALKEVRGALAFGAAGGAAIAWLGARGLQATLGALLFEVRPDDGRTLAGAMALLAAVALLAAWWPARRAARADPMAALREE